MKKIYLLIALFTCSFAVLAQSLSESGKMTFQGSLYQNGEPFNGTTELTFSMELTGGTWTETLSSVEVANGLYAVVLGNTTPIPIDLFLDAPERVISVTVDGTTLGQVTIYPSFVSGVLDVDSVYANGIDIGTDTEDNIILRQDGSATFKGAIDVADITINGEPVAFEVDLSIINTNQVLAGENGMSLDETSLDIGGGLDENGDARSFGGASIGRKDFDPDNTYLGYMHVNGNTLFQPVVNVEAMTETGTSSYGRVAVNNESTENIVLNGQDGSATFVGSVDVGALTVNGAPIGQATLPDVLSGSDNADVAAGEEIYGVRGEVSGTGADNFQSKYSGVIGVGNAAVGDNAGVRGEVIVPAGNTNGGFSKGVQGTIHSDEPSATGYAVRGDLTGQFGFSSAVRGIAGNTQGNGNAFNSNNIGGFFSASQNPEINVGVVGDARGDGAAGSRNIGVSGESTRSNSIENIGVFGTASGATGDNWAGFFDGATKVTGDLSVDGPITTNEINLGVADFNAIAGDGSANTNNGGNINLRGYSETSGIRMYGEFLGGDQNPVSHLAMDDNSGSYVWLWGSGDIEATGSISATGASFTNPNDGQEVTNIISQNNGTQLNLKGFVDGLDNGGGVSLGTRWFAGGPQRGYVHVRGTVNPVNYFDANLKFQMEAIDRGDGVETASFTMHGNELDGNNAAIPVLSMTTIDDGALTQWGSEISMKRTEGGGETETINFNGLNGSGYFSGDLTVDGSINGNVNVTPDFSGQTVSSSGLNIDGGGFHGMNISNSSDGTYAVVQAFEENNYGIVDITNDSGDVTISLNGNGGGYFAGNLTVDGNLDANVNNPDVFLGVEPGDDYGLLKLSKSNDGNDAFIVSANGNGVGNPGGAEMILRGDDAGDKIRLETGGDAGAIKINDTGSQNAITLNGLDGSGFFAGGATFGADVNFGGGLVDSGNPFLQDPNTLGYLLQNDQFGLSFRMQNGAGSSLELDGDNGNINLNGTFNDGGGDQPYTPISLQNGPNGGEIFVSDNTGTSWVHFQSEFQQIKLSTDGGNNAAFYTATGMFGGDGAGSYNIGYDGNATFSGNVNAGTLTADDGFTSSSDKRLKKAVKTIDGALEKTSSLRGVTYQWNKTAAERSSVSEGADKIGVIAQELEAVFPELVKTGKDGYKSVDYASLTAVLIEAIKELNAEVKTLKSENAELKAEATKTAELSKRIETIERLLELKADSSTSSAKH